MELKEFNDDQCQYGKVIRYCIRHPHTQEECIPCLLARILDKLSPEDEIPEELQ